MYRDYKDAHEQMPREAFNRYLKSNPIDYIGMFQSHIPSFLIDTGCEDVELHTVIRNSKGMKLIKVTASDYVIFTDRLDVFLSTKDLIDVWKIEGKHFRKNQKRKTDRIMEGGKLRRHLIQFFRWQLEQGYIDTEDKMYVPYEIAERYLDEKGIDYSLPDSTLLKNKTGITTTTKKK